MIALPLRNSISIFPLRTNISFYENHPWFYSHFNFQVARQLVQFSHSTLYHMSGGFFSLQGATEELIHKIFGTFYTNDFSTSVVVGLNHKKSEAAANSQGISNGILRSWQHLLLERCLRHKNSFIKKLKKFGFKILSYCWLNDQTIIWR